jgi:hypothetical protein
VWAVEDGFNVGWGECGVTILQEPNRAEIEAGPKWVELEIGSVLQLKTGNCVPQKSRLLWGDKEVKLKSGGREDRPVKHNPMTIARDLILGFRRIAGQAICNEETTKQIENVINRHEIVSKTHIDRYV